MTESPTIVQPKGSVAAEQARLSTGHALVRLLKASGITDWYGVAGGMFSAILKEIERDADLRYVGTRHEASGAMMAAGTFAGTGRIAACVGEMAPGAANLLAGMGNAYNNNLAVLAITTSPPRERAHPFRGMFMEWNGREAFRPFTKYSEQVGEAARVPEVLRAALREALTGRPGPVHVDLPADVAMGEGEFDLEELDAPVELYVPSRRVPGDPAAISRAAGLLANAERPLLIAGGGVVRSGATDAFRSVARAVRAATTATQMGLGAVDSTAPEFIGHGGVIGGPALMRAMREADVVLAVGCRWSSWMWQQGGIPAVAGLPQQLIQVDIDPTMIGRRQPTSVPIAGDARTVLEQLLDELAAHECAINLDRGWQASLVEDYRGYRAGLDELAAQDLEVMHPARVAKEVGAWLPDDSLVVYDGGHTTFWSNDLTPATRPATRFHDPGMAQLGFGLPWALALKLHHPDRTVVNITGDGTLGFTLQELDTARRYGLNVINVVHDNEGFGIIRAMQQTMGYELGAALPGTDYVAIAAAFGCHAERVTRPEDIGPALDRAVAAGRPSVIDVATFFEHHPSMDQFRATSRPRS
jgi:thiamine pyrophosphate-dependent acetolactate synthase large subunit-like protein